MVTPPPRTCCKEDRLELLTPCSSSLRSCSGTFGELMASLRHWIFSSGMTYSSTSFSGRPRAVPCRAVDGMASSRIAPRSVVSLGRRQTSLGVWSWSSVFYLIVMQRKAMSKCLMKTLVSLILVLLLLAFLAIKAIHFKLQCVFCSHTDVFTVMNCISVVSINSCANVRLFAKCSIYSEELGRAKKAK